jgi:hypothetical protein
MIPGTGAWSTQLQERRLPAAVRGALLHLAKAGFDGAPAISATTSRAGRSSGRDARGASASRCARTVPRSRRPPAAPAPRRPCHPPRASPRSPMTVSSQPSSFLIAWWSARHSLSAGARARSAHEEAQAGAEAAEQAAERAREDARRLDGDAGLA